MASKQSIKSAQTTRRTVTLELAMDICPNEQIAEKVASHFGLAPVDYETIRQAHEDLIVKSAAVFDGALNERATALHFQRIVGAHVGSAYGAGQFYTQKVSDARDQTSKLANDHRDEDREGPAGFDSKAQRARDFAAEMALQAFALLAAAEGMVDGYKQVTGEEWKPYVAPADNNKKVDRQSADAELSAFGG